MYVVDYRLVKEVLEFRIKSFKAIGATNAAEFIELDLANIARHQFFEETDKEPTTRDERLNLA